MKRHNDRADWRETKPSDTQNRNAMRESSPELLGDGMDTVALSQYLETRGAQSDLPPEKKLMLAVLQDAVDCFRKNLLSNREKKSALFHEAEAWILAEGHGYLFSFENICEVFDIDPGYLRKGLMIYKRRKEHKRAA